MRTKTFNKFQIFKQETWNFCNFINKFKKFVLKAEKTLNNKIKKALYKKILKKELVLISMDIDSNTSFEAYRT